MAEISALKKFELNPAGVTKFFKTPYPVRGFKFNIEPGIVSPPFSG